MLFLEEFPNLVKRIPKPLSEPNNLLNRAKLLLKIIFEVYAVQKINLVVLNLLLVISGTILLIKYLVFVNEV